MLLGCGAEQVRAPVLGEASSPALPAQPETIAPAPVPPPPAPAVATHTETNGAYDLLIAAAGCWMGGVWSDAEGVSAEGRAENADRRCRTLIRRVYGAEDQARYERLRALDAVEVFELREKLVAAARDEGVDVGRQQLLASLLDRIADVERETMFARRAGDRVKMDVEGERERPNLGQDVLDAVAPLAESAAFETLLHDDFGPLTHDARAVALLAAMDRMEIARGLPKHLKVYVVGRPFQRLFGVPAPEVPANARKPLKPGAWLAYLTSVAQAGKHPVPDIAKSLPDRELLAWGGTLAALSDKLGAEAEGLPPGELKRVTETVVQRLYTEYRASEAAVLSETAHPR